MITALWDSSTTRACQTELGEQHVVVLLLGGLSAVCAGVRVPYVTEWAGVSLAVLRLRAHQHYPGLRKHPVQSWAWGGLWAASLGPPEAQGDWPCQHCN